MVICIASRQAGLHIDVEMKYSPATHAQRASCVIQPTLARPQRLHHRPRAVPDDHRPLDDVEGMVEAQELFVQASKMADLQTRLELTQQWQSEGDWDWPVNSTFSPSSTSARSPPSQSQQSKPADPTAALKADIASKGTAAQGRGGQQQPGPQPMSQTAFTAFFLEQGLSSMEALELWRTLGSKSATSTSSTSSSTSPSAQQPQQQQGEGSGTPEGEPSGSSSTPTSPRPSSPLTLDILSARIARWQRVLPGISVARLLVRDPELLEADVSQALQNLITLVSAFPGREVTFMAEKCPKLLREADLLGLIKGALATLTRLHPSGDEDVVKDMIAEYPELLIRMPYYSKARMLDELPLEIQNMTIVADQSLSQTFRYYRNRRTGYAAEVSSDEPFDQHT